MTDYCKAFVILPSAGLLVGGCWVDSVCLFVLLRVVELVPRDVWMGVEAMLELLCCIVVAVTGGVVCVGWRDVPFMTSAVWRQRGSLLWKKKLESFVQTDVLNYQS